MSLNAKILLNQQHSTAKSSTFSKFLHHLIMPHFPVHVSSRVLTPHSHPPGILVQAVRIEEENVIINSILF
jgi:hypothetical protein